MPSDEVLEPGEQGPSRPSVDPRAAHPALGALPTAEVAPALSRSTFDAHWLTSTTLDGSPPAGFVERVLVEVPNVRGAIHEHLARALLEHHAHRQRISDRLRALGHESAAAFFRMELPKSDKTRKGNFGEVVASEHLIQRYGYTMPVFKLRFRDSHNLPMRGEDIVAFELDASAHITRVVIGEAKTVVTFRRETVVKAHERLLTAFNPRPMTLSMLSEILYEAGQDMVAQEIDRVSDQLASGDFPRDNWLFLINERQPDDAFAVLAAQPTLVPNLNCARLPLRDLTAFVTSLFEAAPRALEDTHAP